MDFVRAVFSAGSASAQTVVAPKVEENSAPYCPGGYHPVAVGDVYQGRYQVIAKLDFGGYSTVLDCARLYGLHKILSQRSN